MGLKDLPALSDLNLLLSYDKLTGKVVKKELPIHLAKDLHHKRIWDSNNSGKEVTSHNKYGYLVVSILGEKYYLHRLIWKLVVGVEPTEFIDHINGIKDDNRWDNLREASSSQNLSNIPGSNPSGFKGISRARAKNPKGGYYEYWAAHISVNNRKVHLGTRKTPEEAHELYKQAAIKYRGEFANTGNNV
jgi:hypothetical protein